MDDKNSGRTDTADSQVADGGRARTYEPPKLTHIGNARDLLAGATGTQADGNPSPIRPNQAGG